MSLSREVFAGLSAGTLIGGAVGFFLSRKIHQGSKDPDVDKKHKVGTDNQIHKSTSKFASALDKYLVDNSLQEPIVLAKLRKHTFDNVDWAIMLADPIQAQLFRVLLKMLNAKKCIEVGTFTGYNALNMAMSIPEDGVVYALDVNDTYVNHGRAFFAEAGVTQKIDIRIAPAVESLDGFINEGQTGTFDFVFIDADKHNYEIYYEKALVLLKTGGMIALDNMLQGGRVVNPEEQEGNRRRDAEALNHLNKKIKDDIRVMSSLLNIADGVTLCVKL